VPEDENNYKFKPNEKYGLRSVRMKNYERDIEIILQVTKKYTIKRKNINIEFNCEEIGLAIE
jgi:hypothetical protein